MEGPSNGRYGAAVATFIAVVSVAVSGYTAYIQRQQVRAQVFPLVIAGTGNVLGSTGESPKSRIIVMNKGTGPALIRDVVVTLDRKPVGTWQEMLRRLYGDGAYPFVQSQVGGTVLSPGESMDVFISSFTDSQRDLAFRFNDDRHRIGMDICYCSTLGDCWSARFQNSPTTTVEVRRCPAPDASSFQQ